MALKTYGTMAVDWEQRVDFDRLRRERLARIKGLLAKSELGSLLCFGYGKGAPGLWSGLSVGLILIGIVLVEVWRRRCAKL